MCRGLSEDDDVGMLDQGLESALPPQTGRCRAAGLHLVAQKGFGMWSPLPSFDLLELCLKEACRVVVRCHVCSGVVRSR